MIEGRKQCRHYASLLTLSQIQTGTHCPPYRDRSSGDILKGDSLTSEGSSEKYKFIRLFKFEINDTL